MSEETPETTDDGMLRKPDLLEEVLRRVDVKKRDAKPVVEAALAIIGDALIAGDEVNLPPLGKLRVQKDKPLENGAHALLVKLRTPQRKDKPAETQTETGA